MVRWVAREAASINKSLSAIGDVVAALTTGQGHVPYRSHALTTLMSDSIGGTAKTVWGLGLLARAHTLFFCRTVCAIIRVFNVSKGGPTVWGCCVLTLLSLLRQVMMVCCSPADYNTKESLSALAFAQRCKNVKNIPGGASPAATAAQVQALRLELSRLKKVNKPICASSAPFLVQIAPQERGKSTFI